MVNNLLSGGNKLVRWKIKQSRYIEICRMHTGKSVSEIRTNYNTACVKQAKLCSHCENLKVVCLWHVPARNGVIRLARGLGEVRYIKVNLI